MVQTKCLYAKEKDIFTYFQHIAGVNSTPIYGKSCQQVDRLPNAPHPLETTAPERDGPRPC